MDFACRAGEGAASIVMGLISLEFFFARERFRRKNRLCPEDCARGMNPGDGN
jgi:hypothetical protein